MSGKQRVLVADDDAVIRNMLAAYLETSYEVLVAKDGLEAINLYEHHVERVAAVVTDLEMPRLNGRLVTQWIHHINPQLPVIIMSGGDRNPDLEDLLQHQYVTFMPKPFDLFHFETQLKRLLCKGRKKMPRRINPWALNEHRP